ncbi:MAG: histidine phosphatase family protein [Deltaproteobacteria bacterium]|nr:MAG: histidine phosphatase family protein [Deltaproteobacteria bacterium]
MMRRIAVLRHAKSSWSSGAGTDHARPLNERGLRTAPLVGEALRDRGWVPDLILSSDSLRTQMTVEGVLRGFGRKIPTQFTGQLYHAGVDQVRRLLPEVPDHVETVLLVGHNPGWESVVGWFSGEYVIMKTADCGLLVGQGESWERAVAEPGNFALEEFLRAREI